MSSQQSNEIFLVNPYQSHASLTPVEAEILWEYAKLAQNLRMVCFNFLARVEEIILIASKVTQKTRLLHEEPDKHMLAKLRILEKKMGLVLTLVSTTRFYLTVILFFIFISSQFKASVWGVINEQPESSQEYNDPNDTTIRR